MARPPPGGGATPLRAEGGQLGHGGAREGLAGIPFQARADEGGLRRAQGEGRRAQGGRGEVPRGHAHAPEPPAFERPGGEDPAGERRVFNPWRPGRRGCARRPPLGHSGLLQALRLRARREGDRGRVSVLHRGRCAARAGPRQLLHRGGREGGVRRGLAADLRERRKRDGDRPAPRQGGADVRDDARPPLRRADGGGAAHELLPGRDPGRGRASGEALRVHALFPKGGRQLRKGRAGPQPRAPVRQGGAAEMGPSVVQLRGAGRAAGRRREPPEEARDPVPRAAHVRRRSRVRPVEEIRP